MSKIPEKDLAQMMMVGFEGHDLPESYGQWLRKGLGGIILFSRNISGPEQLAHLTEEIQYAAGKGSPCLIGADQEGGRVFRLRAPFTHFPAARVLGNAFQQTGKTEFAYAAAKATALELAAMGIRLNFAPVLDVDTHPDNPIIGDRAFSRDPQIVATLALAIMEGFRSCDVIACGKHFPGHGGTAKDSHLELPVVDASLEELQSVELIPFVQAIHHGLEMIMPAHVLYPKIDGEFPATLSEKILQDLLFFQLRFKGIVISDDLEMKAIADRYTWKEVVVRAIHAGIDILLVCKREEVQQEVFAALIEAVETGEITRERISMSLRKIASLKKRVLVDPRPFPMERWQEIVGSSAHRELVASLSQFA